MDGQLKSRGGPLYWLGRRSRHFFWNIAVVLMPALYVASVGPANWLYMRQVTIEGDRPSWVEIYSPLELAADNGPDFVWEALGWYLKLWE